MVFGKLKNKKENVPKANKTLIKMMTLEAVKTTGRRLDQK